MENQKQLRKIQIILFKNSKDPQFLLLKTSKKRELHIWQGITGGVEETDSSLKAAAVRELGEELSITAKEEDIIGPVHKFSFTTNRKGYEGRVAHEYCFGYELPVDYIPQLSREHEEFIWLPYEKAITTIDFNEPKVALRNTFMNCQRQ